MKNVLLIMLFFISVFACAQENEEVKQDLKVGLVLSGGGAKGLAHIGAIKVIEAAGVRIDYIGGTSMGAIVGALYASGYSGEQLDSIVNSMDFESLIRDEVPRGAKTFFEKDDAEKYAVTLPFDDFKLSFPSGISKGQNVYNLLSRLLIHVKDVQNFEELPIPFFCVATNVETGGEELLESGYLPRAVTASGALPSLFSPVTINDITYVDGGVTNNYPVDEMRAKGVDIIIGIDVQDELLGKENLKSALDIMVQINNFRTTEVMEEKKDKTDIYIHPKIDEFNVVAFDRASKIIDAGEEAAMAMLTKLQRTGSLQSSVDKEKVVFNNKESLYIKGVDIKGISNYTRAYVLGKLKMKTPSEITYEQFNEGVNNLSATENFEGIDYKIIEDPDNANEYYVNFDLKESDSKTLLRAAVHFDDLYRTAGLVNVTKKRLLTNNDVASLDLVVGDNLRYNFEYYIDKGYYWSVGASSAWNSFKKDVSFNFIDSELIIPDDFQLNELELRYDDFTNRLYAQTVFQRTFLLRLGGEHKWLRYLSETIGVDENNLPRTVFENTDYFSAYGILKYDTFNDKYFPTEGLFLEGDFHTYLFATGQNKDFAPFSIARAQGAYAYPITDNFSVKISTEGGVKIGSRTTNSLDFFLGGYGYRPINNLVPFYGYEGLSIRGDSYVKSDLSFDYEIFRKNHINVSANIANVGDRLFEAGDWIDGVGYTGFAIGYGLESFLGPLEIKYSFSPELKGDEWYVSAGFRF